MMHCALLPTSPSVLGFICFKCPPWKDMQSAWNKDGLQLKKKVTPKRYEQQIDGDVQQAGSGLISSGQSGFLVITPFKLANRE